MGNKSRRQDYAETTKKALISRARYLFATDGFANTSIDEIVKQERLTKGALYHHFKDKKQLFETVVDELIQEIVEQASSAIHAEDDPWKKALIGLDAYLDCCINQEYQRIVIQEAPVVLGWIKWKEKEKKGVMGLLTMLIEYLMEAGLIRKQSVELVAPILFGAITEAALAIAHSNNPIAAHRQAKGILERIIMSL